MNILSVIFNRLEQCGQVLVAWLTWWGTCSHHSPCYQEVCRYLSIGFRSFTFCQSRSQQFSLIRNAPDSDFSSSTCQLIWENNLALLYENVNVLVYGFYTRERGIMTTAGCCCCCRFYCCCPRGLNSKYSHHVWILLLCVCNSALQSIRPLSRRRAEFLVMRRAAAEFFLWLSRIPAEFFKRSSQPNIFRHKFGANIQHSLNETDYTKSSHFS